jgi:hypothetical protein
VHGERSIPGRRVHVDAEVGEVDFPVGADDAGRPNERASVEQSVFIHLEQAENGARAELAARSGDGVRCGTRDPLRAR